MEFLKLNFNSTKATYFAKEILNIPTTAVVVDKNISYKNTPIPIGEGNAPAFECRLLKGSLATCFKFIQLKPRPIHTIIVMSRGDSSDFGDVISVHAINCKDNGKQYMNGPVDQPKAFDTFRQPVEPQSKVIAGSEQVIDLNFCTKSTRNRSREIF